MASYQVAVAEALATWRDAERLLDELPLLSPDRHTVAALVDHSRDVYLRLTSDALVTADVLARSRERIAVARELLAEIRATRRRPASGAGR